MCIYSVISMYAFVSFCMHESSTASLVNAYNAFRSGGTYAPPHLAIFFIHSPPPPLRNLCLTSFAFS